MKYLRRLVIASAICGVLVGGASILHHTTVIAQPDLSGNETIRLTSVSQLSSSGAGLNDGDLAIVSGYSTPGDGGGGTFRLDLSGGLGAGADDGGVIVAAAGPGNRYWRRVINESRIMPQWWGAKADGSTDDTTAIASAISALENANISSTALFFPAGTYVVDGGLDVTADDVVLHGFATIKLKGGAEGGDGIGMMRISGDRVTVRDLTFRGNADDPPNWDPGVNLNIVGDKCRVVNCKSFDARSDATSTQQSNFWIEGADCILSNCHSENAFYALYHGRRTANKLQIHNCTGTKGGAGNTRGLTISGGTVVGMNSILIDGLVMDDLLLIDIVSENNEELVENITVNGVSCIVDVDNNPAVKFAHVRNLKVTNSHFENTGSGGEGLAFGERIMEGTFVNTLFKGVDSHVLSFGAGAIHRTTNRFAFIGCTFGRSGEDPASGIPANALDVKAFHLAVKDCSFHRFATRGIQCEAEEDGIEGGAVNEINDPSTLTPSAGEAWIVGGTPVGDWAGEADNIAIRLASSWTFETPTYGVRVYDKDTAGGPAAPEWFMFINATDGWVQVPAEQWGLDVQGNLFTGYKATDLFLVGADTQSAVKYNASSSSKFASNTLSNLGAGGFRLTSNLNYSHGQPGLTVSVTATQTIGTQGTWDLDSSGGAITATVPDGHFYGERVVVTMSDATTSSSVEFDTHEGTSTYTFDDTADYVIAEWQPPGEWADIESTAAQP